MCAKVIGQGKLPQFPKTCIIDMFLHDIGRSHSFIKSLYRRLHCIGSIISLDNLTLLIADLFCNNHAIPNDITFFSANERPLVQPMSPCVEIGSGNHFMTKLKIYQSGKMEIFVAEGIHNASYPYRYGRSKGDLGCSPKGPSIIGIKDLSPLRITEITKAIQLPHRLAYDLS